jgi:hypothetical protein
MSGLEGSQSAEQLLLLSGFGGGDFNFDHLAVGDEVPFSLAR